MSLPIRTLSFVAMVLVAGCSDDSSPVTPPPPPDPVADLSLTSTVSALDPDPGTAFTYTVSLCNAGPDAASDVGVLQSFPSGLSYVSHSGDGVFDPDSAFWSVDLLEADSTCANLATLAVVVRLDPDAILSAMLVHTAQVTVSSADDPDSTPANSEPGEDDQASVTSLVGGIVDDGGFVGDFGLQRWTENGIPQGTTFREHPTQVTSVAAFGYDVNLGNPGPGVFRRTTRFQMVSPVTGRIGFDWEYSGFHAFFQAQAYFAAFSSVQTFVMVNDETVSGNFARSGSLTIDVVAGQPFGFELGGKNGDSNSRLRGRFTVSNLDVQVDPSVATR